MPRSDKEDPQGGAPVNREALAAEQAALVGGGPVPGGFDPERVRATSAALAREGRLPDSARVERLAARAHPSTRPPGRDPGRPAPAPGRDRPRPGLGERWLSLPPLG